MSGSPRTIRFGFWKGALFSAIICGVFLAALELGLWAAGVKSVIEREDPSRGFSGLVSVFERAGDVFRTKRFGAASPFNDQSFLATKPRNGLRIFTLGGSSAYGHPWGAQLAFTAIVGDAIAAAHPNLRVEAVNAAGVSYAIHRLGIVADEILEHEPDILIVYSGANEFAEPTFFSELKRRSPERNRLEYLAWHSRIYSAMRSVLVHPADQGASPEARFDMFVRRNESHTYTSAQKSEVAEAFQAELRRIVRRAQARGVKVIVATEAANRSRWRPNQSIVESSLDEAQRSSWAIALEAGKRRIEAGAFADAAVELERAIEIAPHHAETQYLLGHAYESLGQWDRARRHYALAADDDASPIRSTSAINRAISTVAGEEKAMLVDVQSIFEKRSRNGLIGFDLIDDYVHPTQDGHRIIAWQILKAMEEAGWLGAPAEDLRGIFDRIVAARATGSTGPNATWLYNQAYMLVNQGQTKRAIEKFREALAIAPNFEPAMSNLAQLLANEGEDEQAGRVLDRLLSQFPENARGRVVRGTILARKGRDEDALVEFRRAVKASPDAAFAHVPLGLLLLKKREVAEAKSAFARAIAIDPNDVDAKLGMARAFEASGDRAAAIEQYRAIVGAHPSSASAHHELGLLLSESGHPADGIRMLKVAAELAPRSPRSLLAIGTIQLRLRDYEDAKRQLQAALRIDPGDAEAHANLGRASTLTGDNGAAIGHYREAIRLKPDWPTPYNNLAWILATDPESRRRDPAEAVALATEAVRLMGQPNPSSLDTLAAAQAAASRFEDAKATARKALDMALASGAERQANEIRFRLERYARGEPYRDVPTPVSR